MASWSSACSTQGRRDARPPGHARPILRCYCEAVSAYERDVALLIGHCAGEAGLEPNLPTYACVRIAHDHRSAAVAVAQKQGDRVVLAVRTFPDVPLPAREYVEAEPIEGHLVDLHHRYPARVVAEVTFHVGGKAYQRPRPGPEVLHHGAFFESSRQRLERQGLVLLDFPSTAERIGPAAAVLMQLVTSGALVHDGDAELARQMARVVARPLPRGWSIASGTDEPIVAVQAAMLAVQRAMTAPRPVSRRVRGL